MRRSAKQKRRDRLARIAAYEHKNGWQRGPAPLNTCLEVEWFFSRTPGDLTHDLLINNQRSFVRKTGHDVRWRVADG